MIVSRNSRQNLSDYDQFFFKKRFEVHKKEIFSSEKLKNSDNRIYDCDAYSVTCAMKCWCGRNLL